MQNGPKMVEKRSGNDPKRPENASKSVAENDRYRELWGAHRGWRVDRFRPPISKRFRAVSDRFGSFWSVLGYFRIVLDYFRTILHDFRSVFFVFSASSSSRGRFRSSDRSVRRLSLGCIDASDSESRPVRTLNICQDFVLARLPKDFLGSKQTCCFFAPNGPCFSIFRDLQDSLTRAPPQTQNSADFYILSPWFPARFSPRNFVDFSIKFDEPSANFHELFHN